MNNAFNNQVFPSLNNGYNGIFRFGRLSVGLVVPIEEYSRSPVPDMTNQMARISLAEKLGFSAAWLRDVPFNVPSFGDVGQIYDPFVYLGYLAAQTKHIALGVSSIVLPLRHPAHVAKSAASADVLSGGRLIMGIASGDRPQEYPAMAMNYAERGKRFRQSVEYINAMQQSWPGFKNDYGELFCDVDMLPKPVAGKVPMLITGSSQQSKNWIAENGDGWMIYPRDAAAQKRIVTDWRNQVADAGRLSQPVMQPLYFDLNGAINDRPESIHLGIRAGTGYLRDYLHALEEAGVNHVAINLRFNRQNIEETLEALAHDVLPHFSQTQIQGK